MIERQRKVVTRQPFRNGFLASKSARTCHKKGLTGVTMMTSMKEEEDEEEENRGDPQEFLSSSSLRHGRSVALRTRQNQICAANHVSCLGVLDFFLMHKGLRT